MNLLFVGHSMLYWAPNDDASLTVPAIFQQLARLGGHEVTITGSYIGAGTLEQHWLDTTGVTARAEIAKGTYDVVMLNGRAWDDATFSGYADKFAELAKASGAEVMFYGLWPGDWEVSATSGDTQAARTAAYHDAAQRNDAALSPNSETYLAVYAELTRLYGNGDNGTTAENMLTVDGIHATALGGYVVACTMYWTYFNEAPPTAAEWRPKGVSVADAEMVQRIVADVSAKYMIPLVPPADPETAEIAGRCFIDADGDGQDEADVGFAGVTVELLRDGEVVATTTTDADGEYSFAGLKAGDYSVRFDVGSSGYRFVKADAGDDASDSDVAADRGDGSGVTAVIVLGAAEKNGTTDAGVELKVVVPPPNNPAIIAVDPVDYDLSVMGSDAAETLSGSGATDDFMSGSGGNDLLRSFGGDDLLDGGAGEDIMTGGLGDDMFIFDSADAVIHGGSGIDRILFRDGGTQDARNVVLASVEVFDLANGMTDDVTLAYQQLRKASDAELRIVAEAGDTVRIGTDQTAIFLGKVEEGGQTYDRWQVGLAVFGIDQDARLVIEPGLI